MMLTELKEDYIDKILEGRLDYSFIKNLINNQTKEFHIRKNNSKFILRIGDNKNVVRGEGINYLHFHPNGCSGNEFEGLPSLNDIWVMQHEGAPHMVISDYGISTYCSKKEISEEYKKNVRLLGFPDVNELISYEARNYDIFRSKIDDEPMKIRMDDALIEYLPWELTNLETHDFGETPNLETNVPTKYIARCLFKK